jgi:hypothetical protein
MIQLPDFSRAWEYENNFYLFCDSSRMSKIIAHYELFKIVNRLPVTIFECGIFKGTFLTRFAMFREMLGSVHSKKIIGFDIFVKFPGKKYQDDLKFRERLISGAGDEVLTQNNGWQC